MARLDLVFACSGSLFFAERADEEFVDTAVVHVDDLEEESVADEGVAAGGHAADFVHGQAAERGEVLVFDVVVVEDLHFLHKVGDRHAALDEEGAVGAGDYLGLFVFVLFRNVAHHALHQVVEGDDAFHVAVFVDDEAELFLLFLEEFQHFACVYAVGDEEGLVGHGAQVHASPLLPGRRGEEGKEILYADNAEYALKGAVDEGVFAEMGGLDERQHVGGRGFQVYADDLLAVGHQFGDALVGEVEHVFQHLRLVLVDHSLLAALVEQQAQFFLGDGGFLLGVDAAEFVDELGRKTQEEHERIEQAGEEAQDGGEEHGVALWIAQGYGFRDELADDERQIGDESHDERDGYLVGIGPYRVELQEEGLDELGQCHTTIGTGDDSDEGNGYLYGGKYLFRLFQLL